MHSVDSLQQCAFLLGEHVSSGVVPPSVTSGEAIIFCINDEQQPAMREMDFVLGHSTADYGQQQCWQKKKEKIEKENSSHKQFNRLGVFAVAENMRLLLYWQDGSDNLCT